ncbi:cdk5rap3 [Cordylochernes scorpioides]|uniref:Cdk5rap3 n=1 Tax=Cordylochernes scorpioides TaxID=51811 RepID=A0ABY6KER1_9ARAC|nr:cdk5rap3 [Cordylochernes scorpioides]
MTHAIPIDINTNKLLEFLITRKHCNRNWPEDCKVIREKINAAIQDMPEHEDIVKLLAGTHLTYFECLEIVEILKKTEANTKNIFGQYSSKKIKDWQEIIKLYEKNNVYLAEAAQIMMRNVKYEIPAIKKHIVKCDHIQDELNKKEHDCMKASQDHKDKFYSSCKQIGIKGENIKGELLELLCDLPEMLTEISSKFNTLEKPCNYYKSFLQHTTSNEDLDEKYLKMIKYIITRGNTTTYEWQTGEIPEVIENYRMDAINVEINENADTQTEDVIDFGDDNSSSTPNGDFVHVEKIDFGDGEIVAEEINWDINSEYEKVEKQESKIACGEDALTILENGKLRCMLMNELSELESFLEQRLVELKLPTDVLSLNLFQNAPHLNQNVTDVESMLKAVREVTSSLSTVKLQHLFSICTSPKYVDRLTEGLHHKLSLSAKMVTQAEEAVEKRKQIGQEAQTLQPKLDKMVAQSKQLQKYIQDALSKKYQNRQVNIMGEINLM